MFYKDKSLNDVWKKNGNGEININSYCIIFTGLSRSRKKLQTTTNTIPISIKYETSKHPFFDS